MGSAAVIANPVAGTGRGRLAPAAAVCLLEDQGFSVELLVTGRQVEATELAARAAERHEFVAALGGDGTVHEVATGILGSGAALVVLPSGSGNDFAAGLGITDPVIGAAAAVTGQIHRIDVGFLDERPFFNSVGLLLAGCVSAQAAGLWRGLGRARYIIAALSALATTRPQPVVWQLAGEADPREGQYLLAEICNGPLTGGGFRLAPDADPSDGLLDVCMVTQLSLFGALRLLPAAARGERFDHPAISRPRTSELTFTLSRPTFYHCDGEPGPYPAGIHRVRLQRGALPVAVPAASGGR